MPDPRLCRQCGQPIESRTIRHPRHGLGEWWHHLDTDRIHCDPADVQAYRQKYRSTASTPQTDTPHREIEVTPDLSQTLSRNPLPSHGTSGTNPSVSKGSRGVSGGTSEVPLVPDLVDDYFS